MYQSCRKETDCPGSDIYKSINFVGRQYGEKGLALNLPFDIELVANQLLQITRDVNLIGVKYLQESHVADDEWKYFACPSKL